MPRIVWTDAVSGLQGGDDARDRRVGEGHRLVVGHGRALGAQRLETVRRESCFEVRATRSRARRRCAGRG